MLQFNDLTIETAVANQGGAMEADTISKNGRSSKSLMGGKTLAKQLEREKLIIIYVTVQ